MSKSSIPTKSQVTYLRRKILHWFKDHKRTYPWRESEDPYRLLIAEMMLQKTPADRVEDVYGKFFSKFPSIDAVVKSERDVLYNILSPLGLEKRFKNFRIVSEEIIEKFGGGIPSERTKLKKLTGVGEYIAGIVCSVAFKQKEWILDSNVIRIFQRFFNLIPQAEKYDDHRFITLAKKYAESSKPRQANLGLVDFGALVCQPREPNCSYYPIKKRCKGSQFQN